MRGTERSGRAEGQTQEALAVSRRAGEERCERARSLTCVPAFEERDDLDGICRQGHLQLLVDRRGVGALVEVNM